MDPVEYPVYRPVPANDTRSAQPNMEDYGEAFWDMDMYPTTHGHLHSGRFVPETSDMEQSDAIMELLAATGTAIFKRRGKNCTFTAFICSLG